MADFTIPPTRGGHVGDVRGFGDIPPKALQDAQDIASRLTYLTDLYTAYQQTHDPKYLSQINNTLATISKDLNDLHSMQGELPLNAQKTLNNLTDAVRVLGEQDPGQVSPGFLSQISLYAGQLVGELGG